MTVLLPAVLDQRLFFGDSDSFVCCISINFAAVSFSFDFFFLCFLTHSTTVTIMADVTTAARQVGIAAKTYYYRLRRLREAAVEQVRSEATQPELVQFTPPAEYAVGQAQSIVIKTIDTTIEIPVNTQPDVVAAAVSFLRQS